MMRNYLVRILKILLFSLGCIFLCLVILFYVVSAPPVQQVRDNQTVNDITQLNPITVGQVMQPTSNDTLAKIIGTHIGKISIGGARHSMGGQIGSDNSLHLDMRDFDEIIYFSESQKIITVQTGITWRKVQEFIDPYNLSVMIMQTYADFTVGGSLSVNVHGRYVGHGPFVHSVRSIKVILPDGTLVTASRDENYELFKGCIGGYGGFGVIVEATLQLVENNVVERQSVVMPATSYLDYFKTQIRNNPDVIFHNADLYPNDYVTVRAVSYSKTTKALTVPNRINPRSESYRLERFAMWMVSEMPGGMWIRQHWADPIVYQQEKVCYRNYEAGYHADELEPTSRERSTYVLQEYFIPVDRIETFIPRMADIFTTHQVNVINVSIRHAHADTLTNLAWARQEVFSFVIYYKQETSPEAKEKVGEWTRALIDVALEEEGSYYLPYQLHATPEQFERAYPTAQKSFELKRLVDPQNKFSNRFWEKYYSRQ